MNKNRCELGIMWLGQSGFIFDCGEARVIVDAYLSDAMRRHGMTRSFPPPVNPETLRPNIICCTQDSPAHFDEPTILTLYKMCHGCVIAGPASVTEHCRKLGFNPKRLVTLHPDRESLSYGGIHITAVKAFSTENNAIGLAMEIGERRIYISGDTRRQPGLEESVENALGGSPDIAIVCINGKAGNMDDVDALRVTKRLAPSIAIPMSYGLFSKNTADPHPFADAVNRLGIEGIIMEPGQKITIHVDRSLKRDEAENIFKELTAMA